MNRSPTFSFAFASASAFFSGVETPLCEIGRAYGTYNDDLKSSIFLEFVEDACFLAS